MRSDVLFYFQGETKAVKNFLLIGGCPVSFDNLVFSVRGAIVAVRLLSPVVRGRRPYFWAVEYTENLTFRFSL